MSLFRPGDYRFVEALANLAYSNPFLPERIDFERQALGNQFDERTADWNLSPTAKDEYPNVVRLLKVAEELLETSYKRFARIAPNQRDVALYEDLLLFVLYHRYRDGLDAAVASGSSRAAGKMAVAVYRPLLEHAERYLSVPSGMLSLHARLPHVFAGFYQIRRAFQNIFQFIIGVSRPAVQLRAQVWQSIFTHDMRRYGRVLFERMADYTTLIMGPSGTGKELVAQAVGLSRYIPFDPASGTFQADFAESFFPVNLSALSPTLIESELFGHKRGSFTGAIADRAGWLEVCPRLGTVFLDEIGELDPAIQVKLLRVLQDRTFVRMGDTRPQQFHGKIIAATNRDLADQMRAEVFREDLYYRLCSDIVRTPSLAQRIGDDASELDHLVLHMTRRMIGDEAEVVADEVLAWIKDNLGHEYPWPGNVRELEQCVRNVLIRQNYEPPQQHRPQHDGADELVAALGSSAINADELLRQYCTVVFAQTGSYEATARKLDIDRRTVKAKIDGTLLERIKAQSLAPPRS